MTLWLVTPKDDLAGSASNLSAVIVGGATLLVHTGRSRELTPRHCFKEHITFQLALGFLRSTTEEARVVVLICEYVKRPERRDAST